MSHDKNGSETFKVRKRVLYQFLLGNKIIVNGKMLKTNTENETDVEISFTQNLLITLHVSIYLGLGLFGIVLGISGRAIMYLPGGILLVVGIAWLIDLHKKFESNIEKYKTLISEILEV